MLSSDQHRVYALKVYKKEHAMEDYKTETDNFERLCSAEAGIKSPSGLIEYFGAYEHGDTFNILLEYGEGGSLHDYLTREDPPTTGKAIHELWSRLFDVVKALSRIHGLEDTSVEKGMNTDQRYQGYVFLQMSKSDTDFHSTHHDIRPNNIILVRDQNASDTGSSGEIEYHFKLADLGNGQFVKRGHESREIEVEDGRGGRNYGEHHISPLPKSRTHISSGTGILSWERLQQSVAAQSHT